MGCCETVSFLDAMESEMMLNCEASIKKRCRRSTSEQSMALAQVFRAPTRKASQKSISPSKGKPVVIPDELINALKGNDLEAVFSGLSLSKRRDYAEYISEAKKEETKIRRLEKILPMIQDGVGLNDKYSKRS